MVDFWCVWVDFVGVSLDAAGQIFTCQNSEKSQKFDFLAQICKIVFERVQGQIAPPETD